MAERITDPELEALLAELAPDEEARSLLLEEHRQLEKDLLRLADPPPPLDFVAKVMAKVEKAPARPMSRAEVVSAVRLTLGSMAAALASLVLTGSAGSVGLSLARFVLFVREVAVAMGSALAALWHTAAVPMVAALGMMLVVSLIALRRVSAQGSLKVIS